MVVQRRPDGMRAQGLFRQVRGDLQKAFDFGDGGIVFTNENVYLRQFPPGLDGGYSWAIVGAPDRKYGWVLA